MCVILIEKVLEQRDLYYTQAESLRRSATPRPRWSKAGEFIEGKLRRTYISKFILFASQIMLY